MHVHPQSADALLAQRDAVTNWEEFAAANRLQGWTAEDAASVCSWTGIDCSEWGKLSL